MSSSLIFFEFTVQQFAMEGFLMFGEIMGCNNSTVVCMAFDIMRLVHVSGALLTAGVLTAGLISFRQGNSQLGQKLMRARVVVQGATVALMVGSAYYYGESFRRSKKTI